jgi:hypothetical protein
MLVLRSLFIPELPLLLPAPPPGLEQTQALRQPRMAPDELAIFLTNLRTYTHIRFNKYTNTSASPKTTDLLILDAVERKDEKSLKRVQKREQVCHRDRLLVEVQKAEGPRQSQQKHQHYGTLQPGPENSKSVKQTFSKKLRLQA